MPLPSIKRGGRSMFVPLKISNRSFLAHRSVAQTGATSVRRRSQRCRRISNTERQTNAPAPALGQWETQKVNRERYRHQFTVAGWPLILRRETDGIRNQRLKNNEVVVNRSKDVRTYFWMRRKRPPPRDTVTRQLARIRTVLKEKKRAYKTPDLLGLLGVMTPPSFCLPFYRTTNTIRYLNKKICTAKNQYRRQERYQTSQPRTFTIPGPLMKGEGSPWAKKPNHRIHIQALGRPRNRVKGLTLLSTGRTE